MFVQWQCPKCGQLNSLEVPESAEKEINSGSQYVDLNGISLPCCDNCKNFFYVKWDGGKIYVH